jgi:hypothetical protein
MQTRCAIPPPSGLGSRARVRELLELVRLPDPDRISKLYPHELSGCCWLCRHAASGARIAVDAYPGMYAYQQIGCNTLIASNLLICRPRGTSYHDRSNI